MEMLAAIDPDLLLVIGVVLLALALPSAINAYSEARAPRLSAVLVLASGVAILYAVSLQPEGYGLRDVPLSFVTVIGRILH
ncbi:hypothetical protein PSA7680_01798 [Pseudoruegeria aquimaris]|uniref:50S ribosomal protein L35 n=1 Tax=Pseudoruegeria aquimaris TaxID=393663 RepID=A0A1Y5SFV3_9RHOB|nr:hypothetical protein [Pseudoruegeria aquimaris]SLN37020.1 hypothetical protein PSA7680_01798 [Pseudoruegeria aquimaris]